MRLAGSVSYSSQRVSIAVCAAISRASGRESGSALARGIVARAADT